MNTGIIILAAGQGTRMRSSLPKVLHVLGGRPLLGHVIDTARAIDAASISVVYGHGGKQVIETINDSSISWAEQAQQMGTGHAVQQAIEHVKGMDTVLVLYGDVPLLSVDSCKSMLDAANDGSLAVLTMILDNPDGYGRILRNTSGSIVGIREQKDASDDILALREVNTGIMAMPAAKLEGWLAQLGNDNAQAEYYLTDIVEMANAEGMPVKAVVLENSYEAMGVNDRVQLAELERIFQRKCAEALMRSGASVRDPSRLDVRGSVSCGQDVMLDINVVLEGEVTIGDNCSIGPNVVIRNSRIGDNVQIMENSVIDTAIIGNDCKIGPFARLRPEAILQSNVHIGNFVEIKKSLVKDHSKINHLSYIGDAEVGRQVNIGAGTITCNYDGANKYRTIIGDNAFIGSSSQLVAPVKIGDGATIGAGSTITVDAPDNELTLSRSKQKSVRGWKRPVKQKH